MGFELPQTPEVSVSEACNTIMGIMAANFQTGRYDEERSVFMGYVEKVKSGVWTPSEGIAAAQAYAANRQEGFQG